MAIVQHTKDTKTYIFEFLGALSENVEKCYGFSILGVLLEKRWLVR
jgi:hypothetical protein